ncbi:hypothetical protein BaRGS_00003393 [Batillaria attramentaria]|uniref:Uncharacterized protein n=1 Tax=Batillaria attramentaria TaxID=370345 RepID=A0ABD0M1R2_9CAEN
MKKPLVLLVTCGALTSSRSPQTTLSIFSPSRNTRQVLKEKAKETNIDRQGAFQPGVAANQARVSETRKLFTELAHHINFHLHEGENREASSVTVSVGLRTQSLMYRTTRTFKSLLPRL